VNPPQTVSASRDYLNQLSWRITHFFGVDQQDAALFLFLVWMNCFGRISGYDLAKGLKQFQRDVNAEIKPKKTRGRPPSGIVAFALRRREDEDAPTYLRICAEWYAKQGRAEWWRKLGATKRREYADRLTNNCGKKRPQKGRDPE
jgi:hypothetical protein